MAERNHMNSKAPGCVEGELKGLIWFFTHWELTSEAFSAGCNPHESSEASQDPVPQTFIGSPGLKSFDNGQIAGLLKQR
jgi:hypothetical protein